MSISSLAWRRSVTIPPGRTGVREGTIVTTGRVIRLASCPAPLPPASRFWSVLCRDSRLAHNVPSVIASSSYGAASGTYKIHLGSGNILMEPNDQYLCIVPDASARTPQEDIFLPFEGDKTLSIIVSKALLLADDAKITDPTITRQIDAH